MGSVIDVEIQGEGTQFGEGFHRKIITKINIQYRLNWMLLPFIYTKPQFSQLLFQPVKTILQLPFLAFKYLYCFSRCREFLCQLYSYKFPCFLFICIFFFFFPILSTIHSSGFLFSFSINCPKSSQSTSRSSSHANTILQFPLALIKALTWMTSKVSTYVFVKSY